MSPLVSIENGFHFSHQEGQVIYTSVKLQLALLLTFLFPLITSISLKEKQDCVSSNFE